MRRNLSVVADGYRAEYGCADANLDAIANRWGSTSAPAVADRDPMSQHNVTSKDSVRMDHKSKPVMYHNPRADCCPHRDVDRAERQRVKAIDGRNEHRNRVPPPKPATRQTRRPEEHKQHPDPYVVSVRVPILEDIEHARIIQSKTPALRSRRDTIPLYPDCRLFLHCSDPTKFKVVNLCEIPGSSVSTITEHS